MEVVEVEVVEVAAAAATTFRPSEPGGGSFSSSGSPAVSSAITPGRRRATCAGRASSRDSFFETSTMFTASGLPPSSWCTENVTVSPLCSRMPGGRRRLCTKTSGPSERRRKPKSRDQLATVPESTCGGRGRADFERRANFHHRMRAMRNGELGGGGVGARRTNAHLSRQPRRVD